jgi:hypothetical protein
MALLPDEQRTAIILKEYPHDLPEIADLQGCPLSTVKTRLYQGLTVLRRHLQAQGDSIPLPHRYDEYISLRRQGTAGFLPVRKVAPPIVAVSHTSRRAACADELASPGAVRADLAHWDRWRPISDSSRGGARPAPQAWWRHCGHHWRWPPGRCWRGRGERRVQANGG